MSRDPIAELLHHLQNTDSREELNRAFAQILHEFNETVEHQTKVTGVKVACRDKCYFCCHIPVDARPHEIFFVMDHLQATRDVSENAAIQETLSAHTQMFEKLNAMQRAATNRRCAFLKNESCSIYEARPLACRMHHSVNVDHCIYSYENPSDLAFSSPSDPRLLGDLIYAAETVNAAYQSAGFDVTAYEFASALNEAIADPECWTRWLNGEPAFRKAKHAGN